MISSFWLDIFFPYYLGRQIDGVWHTGVGVYGKEYLFGSSGVSYTAPEEIYRQGLAPKPKVYVYKLENIWIDFDYSNHLLDVILVRRKKL